MDRLRRRWFRGDFGEFTPPVTSATSAKPSWIARSSSGSSSRSSYFPIRHAIEDLIADGDRVALRLTMRGAHRGEYHGMAPTNRNVEFTGLVMYRIDDGRIAESWGEIDSLRLMRQLWADA